ncbi:MAG TPA: hypothetical protein VGA69_11305 [Nitriliruptorales bacterium]
MDSYDFVLIVDGIDLTSDDDLDRLFEAGLDDATPSVVDSVQYLDVTREAGSYGHALFRALREVGDAGGTIRHVFEVDEHGQPRPGLVSLSDIARRTGWSREYVRLLAAGKRGPGGFPAPHRDAAPALYAWADVIEWLARHPEVAASAELITDIEREREHAGLTRFANVALELEQIDWERVHLRQRDVTALLRSIRGAIEAA